MKKFDLKYYVDVDGKLTFFGIVDTYFDEMCINYHWKKESTKDNYIQIYNRTIFPNIPNDIPVDELQIEDLQNTIDTIEQLGKGEQENDSAKLKPYSATTIEKFRYLIYVVIKTAYEKKLCDDFYWGTEFDFSRQKKIGDVSPDSKAIRNFKLKKSFSSDEEKKIYRLLLENEEISGEEMGVMLMFCFGLRNGEACAVKYGDFIPMDNHPEYIDLYIYESIAAGSKRLQSGGKTKNVPRIIPVPQKCYELIIKRKEKIQSVVGEDQNIDRYPVACKDSDPGTHISASELTKAAKNIFKEAGIDKRILIYISYEIATSGMDTMLIEKDATAYLFRRNFATHLAILGLDEAEIQYIIGHNIEDIYQNRSDFVDEEKRFVIALKMRRRPLLNDAISDQTIVTDGQKGKIHLAANEPMDSVRISIDTKAGYEVTYYEKKPSLGRTICVNGLYQEIYS